MEFALLGCLACFTARRFTPKKRWFLTVPIGYAVLTAFADEGIQLFSDGRAGRLTDVLIDSAGAVSGMLFAFGCIALASYIRSRKEKTLYAKHKTEEMK